MMPSSSHVQRSSSTPSWAKLAPIVSESAGKRNGKNATGKGNRYLARTLGEAVVAAARTDTFLGERYRRLARRRGKKKAIAAVGTVARLVTVIFGLQSSRCAGSPDVGLAGRSDSMTQARSKRFCFTGYALVRSPWACMVSHPSRDARAGS
jgi:transposase